MKKTCKTISVILLRLQINRIIRPGALVRVLICLAVISATAIGCGWFGTSETVRFNHFLKGHDFFRLPPLPRAINSVTGKPVHWYDLEVDSESDTESVNSRHPGKDIEQAWHLAESAEERGELSELRQHLRDYLKFSDLTGDEFGNRNSAFDRLDALQSLDQGTSVKAVSAYLAARAAYDYENYRKAKAIPDPSASGAESSYQLITTVPAEANLKDNIAYLQAALLYRDGNFEEAVKAFTHLAASYPRSEKREAALLMAAISTMKQSRSFTGGSGDPSHNHSYNHYGSPESDPEEVPETCCDAAWQAAKQAFLRQLREYPRGRYESDARGWLAYLHLRAGDRASALIEYYRMLANERDPGNRLNAVFSLTFTRHHATTAQMDRVEAVLADEPAAALAYAYHNLYNYAIDPGEDRSFWGGDKEVKNDRLW